MIRRALLAVLLVGSACGRELTLPQEPERLDPSQITLSGRVVALLPERALPTPVEGATLLVLAPDGTERATAASNAEGRFALRPGLPPWALLVSADLDADGVADSQLRLTSDELPLLEGADLALGELLLQRSVTLSGTVRRGDLPQLDRGHAGLLVEVPGVAGALTRTNEEGRFRLERLPIGPISLRLSAAGYLDEQLALELRPGAELTLADLTLTPIAPVAPGAITGTVVREDGGAGEVVIEALRTDDGRSVARLVQPLGRPFRLEGLPPGEHQLQCFQPGYGVTTVSGLLVPEGADVDVGTVLLRATEGLVRDGAVATWEPGAAQVLPALGAIRAALDVPLDPSSFPRAAGSARILRLEDADGHEVPGDQLYVLAGDALPDGSIAARPTIWFSPRRPLAPGRYVGSLPETLRDTQGRIVQASRIDWTCLGPAAFDLLDADQLTASDASVDGLRLGRRADGSTHLLFREQPSSGEPTVKYCRLEGGGRASCRPVFSSLAGGTALLQDFDVLSFQGGEAFVARDLGGPARACPISGGVPGVLTVEGPSFAARLLEDPAGNARSCARTLAVLPDGSGALFSDWSLDGAELLVRQDPILSPGEREPLGFRPNPAVVTAPAPTSLAAVPVGGDSVLVAWDAALGDDGHRLFRLTHAGGLQRLPSLPLATRTAAEIPSVCDLGGQPLALLARGAATEAGMGGAEPASAQAFRFDPTSTSWLTLPPLVPAGAASSVVAARCARVGTVTFAVALVDEQVRLAWWTGERWEPILAADHPDGALGGVTPGSGCFLQQPALLGGPDGVDVAWVESCWSGQQEIAGYSDQIHLRRVR